MKCYKDKLKIRPQLLCGINFTIWDMATKGFWGTKHLLMLLKSIHKTLLTPQNGNSNWARLKIRNTRSCIWWWCQLQQYRSISLQSTCKTESSYIQGCQSYGELLEDEYLRQESLMKLFELLSGDGIHNHGNWSDLKIFWLFGRMIK